MAQSSMPCGRFLVPMCQTCRIVAATAIFLRVPVISPDGHIRSSDTKTIW